MQKIRQRKRKKQWYIDCENPRRTEALEELMLLHDTKIDISFEKIKIPLDEEITLSPNDIQALTPFIDFVNDDNDDEEKKL